MLFNYYWVSIPKDGNDEKENEDAVALMPGRHQQQLTKFRCVVADGATQASFSRLWANILVNNAIKGYLTPSINKYENVVKQSCEEWNSDIEKLDLSWFAKEKVTRGAFSTFLWIGMNTHKSQDFANLSAVSIGDTELIIVRNEKVIHAQPLGNSNDFNSSPMLISSKNEKNRDLRPNFSRVRVVPGDDVILSTDALAKYLLSQYEMGINPLVTLEPLIWNEQDRYSFFKDWITTKRRARVLKNDDSTMVWIHLANSPS